MNGEMFQACRIVIAAKKAIKDKKQIVFEPLKYEMNIMFEFLSQVQKVGVNSLSVFA